MITQAGRARRRSALGIPACGLLLWCTLAFATFHAHATSLRRMSLRELVQRSQKIVRGTITSLDCQSDARHRLWTLYTLTRASAAKGALTSHKLLRFRCLGGERDGHRHQIPGVPELALGDDVVIFYAPDNAACQVMGWMQGHFRALTAPSGVRNVFDHADLPVIGMSTESLVLGNRPLWLHTNAAGARFVDPAAFATQSGALDTAATPEDFMFDLGALARYHANLAPEDRASDGTDTAVGELPDMRPVNPLIAGVTQ